MDEAELTKALDRDDSYRVIRTLAETNAGKTELVRGPGAGLLVRKYVPRELANERAWRKLREIEHPLLPQVRDLYWLPDFYVVVTTYVDGITLGELVESTGPLSVREAIGYLQDLCGAAGELHAHGIVHRDITPSNAVVAAGHAALIDLGNAHAHVEGADRDTTTLGTWGFAAPEQFGFAQTDARSDVYALGGLLAYLVTGVKPGDEGFDEALANERLVPRDVRMVVQKARAFEPSARYQAAAELADAAKAAFYGAIVMPIDLDAPDRPKAVFEERPPKTRRMPEAKRETARPADVAWEGVVRFFKGWMRLGLFDKVKVVFMWLFLSFFATGFFAAGFDSSSYKRPGDSIYFPFSGILWAVCTVLFCVDAQNAIVAKSDGEVPRSTPLIIRAAAKYAIIAIVGVVIMAALTSLPTALTKE